MSFNPDRKFFYRLADHVNLDHRAVDAMLDRYVKDFGNKWLNYWAIVDFTRSSAVPRLFVFDVKKQSINGYLCAHGKGSDGGKDDGITRVFSNESGSNCSSLGLVHCAEPYTGKHGLSLRLDGMDDSNSHIRSRAIVLHGAWYVSPKFIRDQGHVGRSDGCFAVEEQFAPMLVEQLKNGSLLLAWKP